VNTSLVLFDQVEPLVVRLFEDRRSTLAGLQRLIVIRDIFGRVRLFVDERPSETSPLGKALNDFAQALQQQLGARAFPPESAFLYGDDLLSELAPILNTSRVLLDGRPELRLLDRQVTGSAWSVVSASGPPQPPPRLAFYSLKGGVGRSTAAAVTAWHLAKQGKTVLGVDLDLEAPGLSTSLLPEDRRPELGLIDWFVEDAVGQGDACIERMVAASPLATELPGQIWVVPAHGSKPGDYLAKLGRCYLDLPPRENAPRIPWAQRVADALNRVEATKRPDWVLLDLRAGLSDLAAVGATDLGAKLLLFTLDTDQTWAGYRLLLDHLRKADVIRSLRERMYVVAALVPETDRERYLTETREHAWDLLRDCAYDAVDPNAEDSADVFSFDLNNDEDAPHVPIPIYWNRGISSLKHVHSLDSTLVEAAFGRFLSILDRKLALEEVVDR